MRRLFLFFALLLALPLGAFGQASPFNLNVFKAQSFSATGQTGAAIQLNGLVIPSTVGSSYASGTITLTGVALTTVSFQVMGSSDNGATYYALPVYSVASPGTSPVTTVTATAAGQYQINLAGMTHIQLVTTGTFTATTVSFTLTGSPNASISRNNGSGGGGDSIASPGGTLVVGGTSAATTLDLDLALANTWTQGMTIQDGLTLDTLDFTEEDNGITFPSGAQIFEDLNGEDVALVFSAGAQQFVLATTDGVNVGNILELAGPSSSSGVNSALELNTGKATAYILGSSTSSSLLDPSNSRETQLGIVADVSGNPPAFASSFAVGNVTTIITNTNIKLVGAVTINGASPVMTFNARTGPAISPASGDYSAAQVTNALDLSNTGIQTMAGQLHAPGISSSLGLAGNTLSITAGATINGGTTLNGASLIGTGGSLGRTGTATIDANVLNGVLLSGLANGLLKFTAGVPSAANAQHSAFSGSSGTSFTSLNNDFGGSYTPTGAITITGFDIHLDVPVNTCTTPAIVAVFDETAGAVVSGTSITLNANGQVNYHVAASASITAGHVLAFATTQAQATCTTQASSPHFNVEYVTNL